MSKNGVLQSLGSVVSMMSLGKYSPKLYHNGMTFYSSFCGGMLTFLCTIGVLVFAGLTLRDTFNRDVYLIDHQYRGIYDTNLTFMDIQQTIYQKGFIVVNSDGKKGIDFTCSALSINAYIGDTNLGQNKFTSNISNPTSCYFYPGKNTNFRSDLEEYFNMSAYSEQEINSQMLNLSPLNFRIDGILPSAQVIVQFLAYKKMRE